MKRYPVVYLELPSYQFYWSSRNDQARTFNSWKCLEHGLEDALEITGHNHQVNWPISRSISQSINQSVSQAISPTHAIAHSRIGSLASSLSTGHEPTLVHSLVCLSVCPPINQSVGQSPTVTRQSLRCNQPASQSVLHVQRRRERKDLL